MLDKFNSNENGDSNRKAPDSIPSIALPPHKELVLKRTTKFDKSLAGLKSNISNENENITTNSKTVNRILSGLA